MSNESLEKVEYCKDKGVALASMIFKISEKDFVGKSLTLEDKELFAKRLVLRIQEKVNNSVNFEETKINTVIPYFDIEYLNIYDHFLKEDNELEKNLRKMTEELIEPEGLSETKSLTNNEDKMGELSKLILNHSFIESNSSETQNKKKLTMSFDPSSTKNRGSFGSSENKSSEDWKMVHDPEEGFTSKTYDDMYTQMPRMIARSDLNETNESKTSVFTLNQKSLSHKLGHNITTNSPGVLFRLSKNLEKRQKLRTHEDFDKSIHLIKELLGLRRVINSITEISNQSLSKLGNPF